MDKPEKDRVLSRQGGRIAAQYREDRRRLDRLMRDAESSQAEAVQRRELIRAATRSGRAAAKAREAADLRLVDALIGLLHAGMSVRTAAERVGVGYHQARQLIRAAEVGGHG